MQRRWVVVLVGFLLSPSGVLAAEPPLNLDPKLIESSPVLQRWLKQVPNLSSEIENDPAFRTRVRVGYGETGKIGDVTVGIEDLRIAQTQLTASADYRNTNWGANFQYYARPLGSYVNIAPVVGYRQIDTQSRTIAGANLGVRALLVLSRGGGADISLTQTWVSPFGAAETGLTTLAFGYAIAPNFRLSTEFQRQNSPDRKDSRVGLSLEWMP
jgi:hypothetical protein